MTRILALSDTHLPSDPRSGVAVRSSPDEIQILLRVLADFIKQANLILHAGDQTEAAFWQALCAAGRTVAVRGNMDAQDLRHELPDRVMLQCERVSIGLIHGWGAPGDLPQRIFQAMPNPKPQVIVFGHSHEAYQVIHEGVLFFNPGSPTRPRRGSASVGWIEVDGDSFTARHINLGRSVCL